jgi:hypothetical protein
MAPRKRKKPVKKVKFQLTRSGIAGIGIVCFCIFLWMFLIGVWAGQSLIYPPVQQSKSSATFQRVDEGKQTHNVIRLKAEKKKIIKG